MCAQTSVRWRSPVQESLHVIGGSRTGFLLSRTLWPLNFPRIITNVTINMFSLRWYRDQGRNNLISSEVCPTHQWFTQTWIEGKGGGVNSEKNIAINPSYVNLKRPNWTEFFLPFVGLRINDREAEWKYK